MKRDTPNQGSWNGWLASFTAGERRYVETSLDKYAQQMRTMNAPKSRRPACLDGFAFSTTLMTAVAASKACDVRYLICVECLSAVNV